MNKLERAVKRVNTTYHDWLVSNRAGSAPATPSALRRHNACVIRLKAKHDAAIAQYRALLSQRGAVSLPLLAFQACAAVGLASGLWSLYLRLVAQIGGLAL